MSTVTIAWQTESMGDSKFVIVTTLCYVGIFGVIFIVCCCAWTRHLRKSSRGLSSQQRNTQTNRRYLHRPTPQPPEYNVRSSPMPYGPPRRGEIQNVNDGGNYFCAASQRAVVGPMFPGYPPMNIYPFGVTSGTHAVEITTYGRDIGHGERITGNDLSSRFDGGDSTFAETEDKTRVLTRSQSSLESEKEVESDVSSSQPSYFQDITLREEQCL